jgi:DNA-directed RNA polymerase subunit RPC12/RpoP
VIRYVCKECGGTMEYTIKLSYPPIHHWWCLLCGRTVDAREDIPTVIVR